jgi:hypothetical protein
MGLFKSAEEKEMERAEKERKLLEKYGIPELSNPDDVASIMKISTELAGTGAMETGMKIAMTKGEIMLPITYQRVLIEQNFILMRQLDRIEKLLTK